MKEIQGNHVMRFYSDHSACGLVNLIDLHSCQKAEHDPKGLMSTTNAKVYTTKPKYMFWLCYKCTQHQATTRCHNTCLTQPPAAVMLSYTEIQQAREYMHSSTPTKQIRLQCIKCEDALFHMCYVPVIDIAALVYQQRWFKLGPRNK